MLNLVYHGSEKPTVDEKISEKLSSRMKDRYDIFGTLPDVIEDDWIEDEEKFDEKLGEFTAKRLRANVFDIRYAADVDPKGARWELCERVLARHDVVDQLSKPWGVARLCHCLEKLTPRSVQIAFRGEHTDTVRRAERYVLQSGGV